MTALSAHIFSRHIEDGGAVLGAFISDEKGPDGKAAAMKNLGLYDLLRSRGETISFLKKAGQTLDAANDRDIGIVKPEQPARPGIKAPRGISLDRN